MKTNERVRRRHITGDSNTASIYSATNSIIPREEKGPGKLKEKGSYCLLTSIIVLLPIIILIIVYKSLPHGKIYIVQAEDGQEITANIVGSYESIGFEMTPIYIDPNNEYEIRHKLYLSFEYFMNDLISSVVSSFMANDLKIFFTRLKDDITNYRVIEI